MKTNIKIDTYELRRLFPMIHPHQRQMLVVSLLRHIFPSDIRKDAEALDREENPPNLTIDIAQIHEEVKELLTIYSAEGLKKHFKKQIKENRSKAVFMCKVIQELDTNYSNPEANFPETGRICLLKYFRHE